MPLDRAATLRTAEKFLRQGKLAAAIAEYRKVVDEQPRDWNTANTLGDLLVRAGQVDKAVEQFVRIADSLNEEGFLPKAAALYKKIIKLKPDDEHALLQAADIASSQGLYADARGHLNTVADRRRGKSDARGVAQIQIRLGSLDPEDYDARRRAAAARVQVNDLRGAIDDFKAIAAELIEKARHAEAIEALREAAVLAPDDGAIRAQLLDAFLAVGDLAQARECATAAAQFKTVAAALEAQGHQAEALDVLREAASLDPDDAELRAYLARSFVQRGDLEAAGEYLTAETAGSDPQLTITMAEICLRGDRVDEGIDMLRRLIDSDPPRREQVALMAWTVAETRPEAGFRAIELAADAGVAQSDWASAAAAFQEFVTRVPNHIPALMRLVEICVDGGLEATMYSAQAQLADAYLEAGSASEALVISEDLVAREPWERANVERFRKALVLSGEPDPDGLIAARLSGQAPFMSTDLLGGDLPPFEPDPPPALQVTEPARAADMAPPAPREEAPAPAEDAPFDLSPGAIDLNGILNEAEPPPTARSASESVEVDLSIVLGGMKSGSAPVVGRSAAQTPTSDPAPKAPASDDLDGVFEHLRDEAARRSVNDAADHHYQNALAQERAGDVEAAVESLTQAARAPKLRFLAASRLGQLYLVQGSAGKAIEWLERAAEAPAPSPEQSHELLYQLAELLESTGETARALAICMELQAEVGDYRDVTARVDRLAKVQTRG